MLPSRRVHHHALDCTLLRTALLEAALLLSEASEAAKLGELQTADIPESLRRSRSGCDANSPSRSSCGAWFGAGMFQAGP
jgi:hypothetical protein